VEGRWTPVKDALLPGDFVFIQFGHNDRDFTKPERYADTATYKSYLRIYVNDTRAKGGFPVLVTPMVMNAWNGTTMRNVFTEGANDYRGAMVDVANKLKVPLVDLNMKSYNLFRSLGRDYITNYLYLTLQPGEYPNYPNGNTDGTHFQEMGAIELSKLIVLGLNELGNDVNVSKLIPNLKPTYQVATNSNNYGVGMITRTNTYPAGLKVTLKTKPNSGFTLQKWTDEANNTSSTATMFFHTMGTSSKTFSAIYSASGTTGITIQENTTGFCKVDGTIDSNNAGFTGAGFANTSNATSAGVVWKINVPASGSYTLTWNHANGVNSDRPGRVLVNGAQAISSLSFPYTGNWTTWNEVSATLNLAAGANTIRLESTTASGLSNIDYLKVIGSNPSKVSCTTSARIADIEEEMPNNKDLEVYPNPFSGWFHLKSPGKFSYTITDTNGTVKEAGKGKDEILVGGNLKPGIFILKVVAEQGSREVKIIKQ
jgi:lysophospholipase L1-like esterase